MSANTLHVGDGDWPGGPDGRYDWEQWRIETLGLDSGSGPRAIHTLGGMSLGPFTPDLSAAMAARETPASVDIRRGIGGVGLAGA